MHIACFLLCKSYSNQHLQNPIASSEEMLWSTSKRDHPDHSGKRLKGLTPLFVRVTVGPSLTLDHNIFHAIADISIVDSTTYLQSGVTNSNLTQISFKTMHQPSPNY